jgi:hypothetical protein
MMRHIMPKHSTVLLVDTELSEANKKHKAFHSEMEALGVIEEERREAEECMEEFMHHYDEFRRWLRYKRSSTTVASAQRMRMSIEYGIEEMIQLAAMCQKYIDMA